MAPVGPLAHEVGQQRTSRLVAEARDRGPHGVVAGVGRLEEQRREQCVLVAVDVHEPHRGAVGLLVVAVEPEPCDPGPGGLLPALQVGDPLAAAIGALDPGHEGRHDRLDGLEHEPPAPARLGQRVRHEVQDERLVRLAGGEHPHVRQRRRGQQPAEEVERLRAHGAFVRRRRLAGRRRPLLGRPRLHAGERLRVGVEEAVHRPRVVRPQLRVAEVAVGALGVHRRVVGDVAGGLLEVRDADPRALEDLRQDVGDPLARDVRGAELRDRVVPVAEEDRVVELRGALALVALEGRQCRGATRRTRRGTAGAACPGGASSARTALP